MTGKMKFVLCYLVRERASVMEVALARKKWREKSKNIGAGRYNGYGGDIQSGETEREACVRETKEECEVIVSTDPRYMKKMAIAFFHNINDDGTFFDAEVHVFLARKWDGEPRESEEKESPEWFSINALPAAEMMPSDSAWLPKVFGDWKLKVCATLEKNQTTLIGNVGIQYVGELPENKRAVA